MDSRNRIHFYFLTERVTLINKEDWTKLFERDKSVISRHIKNIFSNKDLEENSVVAFFATTALDGKVYNVKYYNLDVIIAVGYRVNSKSNLILKKRLFFSIILTVVFG